MNDERIAELRRSANLAQAGDPNVGVSPHYERIGPGIAGDIIALLDALETAREKVNRWMAAHEKSEWQGMGYMEERDQLRAENERLREAAEDWKRSAEDLWCLLDDIDTASDIAKDDLVGYQAIVEGQHRKRFDVATSDGYNLTWLRPSLAASPEQEGQ